MSREVPAGTGSSARARPGSAMAFMASASVASGSTAESHTATKVRAASTSRSLPSATPRSNGSQRHDQRQLLPPSLDRGHPRCSGHALRVPYLRCVPPLLPNRPPSPPSGRRSRPMNDDDRWDCGNDMREEESERLTRADRDVPWPGFTVPPPEPHRSLHEYSLRDLRTCCDCNTEFAVNPKFPRQIRCAPCQVADDFA